MKTRFLASSAVALMLAAGAAGAQSLSYGVTLTTNYVSRGNTNTNHGPAIQPWMEYGNGGFYVGAWASNLNNGTDTVELDLYGGYRMDVGSASFDLGYARYIYNGTTASSGEVYLLASVSLSDRASVFAGIYADPATSFTVNDTHIGMDLSLASNLDGRVKFGRAGGMNYTELGVSYAVNDTVSLGLTGVNSTAIGTRFVASVSLGF